MPSIALFSFTLTDAGASPAFSYVALAPDNSLRLTILTNSRRARAQAT